MRALAQTRFGLLLLSSIASIALVAGAYEIAKNVQYSRWRARFDNSGWFGKVTIPSPNPELIWEYRPYGKFEQIEMNRHGFRDLDYASTARPENTRRIAFAGDSVTLGMGVTLEETFVRQFESEANRTDRPREIQALNFSVDGYNTPQIYELIRTKVLAFSPDEVVYVMCMNDFDFAQSSGDKLRYFRKPKSFFLQAIENTYLRIREKEFHHLHFRRNKSVVFEKLVEMKELLEGEGIRFSVVLMPVFPASFDPYPLEDLRDEIGAFLAANEIHSADLLAAFIERGEPPKYYASDVWHLNARGHQLVARALVSAILPGAPPESPPP